MNLGCLGMCLSLIAYLLVILLVMVHLICTPCHEIFHPSSDQSH